jgi:two-component system phosphate regulon sensor histidine kinase PhoR
MKLHHKLLITFGLITAAALIFIFVYLDKNLNKTYVSQLKDSIKKQTQATKALLLKIDLNRESIDDIVHTIGKDLALRVTIIDSKGIVVGDSEIDHNDLVKLENHLKRPEIMDAIKSGEGWSQRFSTTIKKDIIYYATTLNSRSFNGFIRLSIPVEKVGLAYYNIQETLFVSLFIVFIATLIVALMAFHLISKPIRSLVKQAQKIAAGDYSSKIPATKKDEVGELARSLNSLSENISNRISEILRNNAKFENVRKDFVANVSHELRTPIANIKGYAETLLDGAIDDEKHARDFIKIIHGESDRLASLINDILDLSKIESDTFKLNLKQNDLSEVVNTVIRLLEKDVRDKSISVHNKLEKGSYVMSDQSLLIQVFINLIHNAIKYSHDNTSIVVSAATDNNFIKIEVEDQGIGIPAQDLPRIFERFYRVDKARSKELGGTGLGLAIVKHIVQAHGGDVFVRSTEGVGSTFGFTVPLA